MSGIKISEMRLVEEQEQRLRLQQDIRKRTGELDALKTRLRAMIDYASQGLRDTFHEQVSEVENWLRDTRVPNANSEDLISLSQNLQTLNQAVGTGRELLEKLTVTFTQKADEVARQSALMLEQVEQSYLSHRDLFRKWLGDETSRSYEERLSSARVMLQQDCYSELQPILQTLNDEISRRHCEAQQLEDAHEKRLYFLKALRQVCADMGFQEVNSPRFEEEGNLKSCILLTVDTLDRGTIQFRISLNKTLASPDITDEVGSERLAVKITSSSEIADDRCFEEFDELSQHLNESFGIVTNFHREGEPRPPRRIQKGEADLPGDAPRQARR